MACQRTAHIAGQKVQDVLVACGEGVLTGLVLTGSGVQGRGFRSPSGFTLGA